MTVRENGARKKMLFSGDLGRFPQLIIREPAAAPEDGSTTCCSSPPTATACTRRDDLAAPGWRTLSKTTAGRGGTVVIPSFAVGRTQELLYVFRELIEQGGMHSLPIHVDSPMAIDVTDLYRRHAGGPQPGNRSAGSAGHQTLLAAQSPLRQSVEESKALNDARYPLHHHLGQRHGDGRARCSSPATLPARPSQHHSVCGVSGGGNTGQAHPIRSTRQDVRPLVNVRARIETIENLSAHADYGEILGWLRKFQTPPRKTFLVHGEPKAAESLRQKIDQELEWDVSVASYLQKVQL